MAKLITHLLNNLILASLISLLSFTVNAHDGHVHGDLNALISHFLWLSPLALAAFMLYRAHNNKTKTRVKNNQHK